MYVVVVVVVGYDGGCDGCCVYVGWDDDSDVVVVDSYVTTRYDGVLCRGVQHIICTSDTVITIIDIQYNDSVSSMILNESVHTQQYDIDMTT